MLQLPGTTQNIQIDKKKFTFSKEKIEKKSNKHSNLISQSS